MPSEITEDLKVKIGELRRSGLTVAAISEALDCSISTASKYQDHFVSVNKMVEPSKFSESGESASSEYTTTRRITTLEDAIKHGNVDTSVWYVDRWECTSWEMGYVRKDGEADVKPLWRVKLYLKRILPKALHVASDAIYNRLASIAPRRFEKPLRPSPLPPLLMCLDLFDAHFGKLAWRPETGSDYDLKIAENLYRNAVADLLRNAGSYAIEKVVMAVGNDFCHFDNQAGQTTSGRPMDCDGRHAKVVDVAAASLLWAIEESLRYADEVEILNLPGNHDHNTSLFLCREARAWFRHEPRVKVDCDPIVMKYVKWHECLIGFVHGDGVSDPRVLPNIMANARRSDWGITRCHEWHLGHKHTSKKYTQLSSDEYNGVQMRWMSALSGTDAWHHKFGFDGNRRAAEAYFYKPTGYHGHFVSEAE